MNPKTTPHIWGYRDWAFDLWQQVAACVPCHYWTGFDPRLAPLIDRTTPCFFVGWSKMIPQWFYEDHTVYVLHPSPLPKYRGGSPIQHQIINGEHESRVTLFRLDPAYLAVDSGPIFLQSQPFSLEGDLQDVLTRIRTFGAELVLAAISAHQTGNPVLTAQDDNEATFYKRRLPGESDMSRVLHGDSGRTVHNFVRALQDPYPNAYVDFPDGRLYVTKTRWEPNEELLMPDSAGKPKLIDGYRLADGSGTKI